MLPYSAEILKVCQQRHLLLHYHIPTSLPSLEKLIANHGDVSNTSGSTIGIRCSGMNRLKQRLGMFHKNIMPSSLASHCVISRISLGSYVAFWIRLRRQLN